MPFLFDQQLLLNRQHHHVNNAAMSHTWHKLFSPQRSSDNSSNMMLFVHLHPHRTCLGRHCSPHVWQQAADSCIAAVAVASAAADKGAVLAAVHAEQGGPAMPAERGHHHPYLTPNPQAGPTSHTQTFAELWLDHQAGMMLWGHS